MFDFLKCLCYTNDGTNVLYQKFYLTGGHNLWLPERSVRNSVRF